MSDLLRDVGITYVPRLRRFIASDHFKMGVSGGAKMRIGRLNDRFKQLFLRILETNLQSATLNVHVLKKNASDWRIKLELGQKSQISLFDFFFTLQKQGHGQLGILPTDGQSIIAYLRGMDGELHSVGASWDKNSWSIVVDSGESRLVRYTGMYVLSWSC